MITNINPLLQTDSYKISHPFQYPSGMDYMQSHLISRGGLFPKVLFTGLQPFVLNGLLRPFAKEDIEEAEAFYALHGEPFYKEGFQRMLLKHGGHFPIRIRAVKEGTLVPTHNVLLTCESLDPEFFWVVGFIETALLRAIWYPTTVATLSYFCRKTIERYLEKSADDPKAEIGFKLHDFGARGVSSAESAAIGGAAHLINFLGSDTVEGIWYANKFYGAEMSAFSIPASEHGTITAWGKAGEADAYRNMIRQFGKPGALFACVSDSYDIYNAVANLWCRELKDEVIKSGATVVIRPDSGEPTQIVPEILRLLEVGFGTTTNSKGYKVLNHVRVIQGDGINYDSLGKICEAVVAAGFSLSNVAFGMGGGLLQQLNRDTQKFAYKANLARVGDEYRPVFKDPVGDPGKKSKGGYLDLIYKGGQFQTIQSEYPTANKDSVLEIVYETGKLLRTQTLSDIRAIAHP